MWEDVKDKNMDAEVSTVEKSKSNKVNLIFRLWRFLLFNEAKSVLSPYCLYSCRRDSGVLFFAQTSAAHFSLDSYSSF